MEIDPTDPRPPYIKVANALRAAILTGKLKPAERLPSGAELAKQFGVARMTAQQAVRVLKDEGLVYSRQGSGVYVKARTERPVGLRPHVERAFEALDVAVDFAGFSSETLHGMLQEQLDKIRTGRLTPNSLRVRILVPDMSVPMAIPTRIAGLADDPRLRARMQRIVDRHAGALVDSVQELADVGLVQSATTEIRRHSVTPMFKLYIINESEVFFGFYPVYEHTITIDGEPIESFDLLGKDTALFHHAMTDDPESTESLHVREARKWFDSVWNTISREYTP
ncbi:GntR family transcriptional regulator [Kribbella sp. NPDC056951]|uniref:GntR family transcriptional regulator n=1 Tax=Kribbella sp. NPDC056951 TaxID=3345978 RepID=UPI00362F5E11